MPQSGILCITVLRTPALLHSGQGMLSRLYKPLENCVEPVKYGFHQDGAE